MTPDEYLDALRAAARAGDRKAGAFLDSYAAGLIALPPLPASDSASPRRQAMCGDPTRDPALSLL